MRVRLKLYLFLIAVFVVFVFAFVRHKATQNILASDVLYKVNWQMLDSGLHFTEVQGPAKTEFGDYKVQILRINPKLYEFGFIMASKFDSTELTAPEWCKKGGYIGVINAGMYHFNKSRSSVGYLKDKDTLRQANLKDGYRMIAAFDKKKANLPDFVFHDLAANSFESVNDNYASCFQSIRMIDECGRPVFWHSKRTKRMSIAALANDDKGNVLYIFCRSPYSANELIQFLMNLPFKVQSAMYLEGGPEASLFIEHGDFCLDKYGSYVSRSFAHDRNDHYWEIPNMLGFRKKVTK